ncbi:hypothetical protein PoB_003918400 [Plakobranchus ocellatus]|uniref:Uncharacterized protein n=1 Tax=Plakobranchus ocellatus TaxID=259542 RepID=A0AAV4AY27_9GAST|nr:hypothetical protein PoB_003918400 [Plakobranchus ocellatus]
MFLFKQHQPLNVVLGSFWLLRSLWADARELHVQSIPLRSTHATGQAIKVIAVRYNTHGLVTTQPDVVELENAVLRNYGNSMASLTSFLDSPSLERTYDSGRVLGDGNSGGNVELLMLSLQRKTISSNSFEAPNSLA